MLAAPLVVSAAVIGVVKATVAPSDGPPATSPRNKPPATSTGGHQRHPTGDRKPTYAPILREAAASSFAQLEAHLPGQVGLAVSPLGRGSIETLGQAHVALAWSTSKVPVLVALLHDYERLGKNLSPEERTDAVLALEQSNNAAINDLFGRLEQLHNGLVGASLAIQRLFRDAGDQSTVVNTAPNSLGFTTEGQTAWSTRGEVLFYRALARGCFLRSDDTAYILELMGNVVSSERWGIGSAGYPADVRLEFKGGWGPDRTGRYQVRQTGIVVSHRVGYVLSILALPTDGSFSEGTSMLTTVASWARRHLNLANLPPTTRACSQIDARH